MDFAGFDTILLLVLAFLVGIVASRVYDELRLVLLLASGFLLSLFAGKAGVLVNDEYLIYLAFAAFALFIFEYVPRLRFEHFDFEKRLAWTYLASALIASLIAGYIFFLFAGMPLFYVFIFSVAMFSAEISYDKKKSKVMHVLGLESSASIVFTLGFLFAFFDFYKLIGAGIYDLLVEKVLLSAGIGLLSAFILLRFASRKKHHNIISLLIVLLTLMASSAIALPGITLACSAILLSKFSSERTSHTFDFLRWVNKSAGLLVVVLAGFVFARFLPKMGLSFILLSLTVFAMFFFARFFIVNFFAMSFREKVFLTLNNPKGNVGALIFLILMLTVPRYDFLWAIFFMQVLYSEIVSFLSHGLEDPSYL